MNQRYEGSLWAFPGVDTPQNRINETLQSGRGNLAATRGGLHNHWNISLIIDFTTNSPEIEDSPEFTGFELYFSV